MSATRIFNGKRVDAANIQIILHPGEMSVDIDQGLLYVHDGVTPGGHAIGGTGQQGGGGNPGTPGVSIIGGYVDQATGDLILEKSDTTNINVGSVRGPVGPTGTTEILFTATISAGFGLQYNSDGTISVNTAAIQTLLPILEIGNPGSQTTEIDTPLIVHGGLSAYTLTVTNAIVFPDGTVMTTAAVGSGNVSGIVTATHLSIGYGLQANSDGTISINSGTIQSLLPILQISTGSGHLTEIDTPLYVHGSISSYALTVTNAIYFPDGTYMTTAATGNGGGGISTATVTALIANSLTNYTATPFKLTSSTQVVSLDSSGTLHTPLLIPKSFTAVLVPVYGFAPGYNPPGPTGGDAWSYEVHFVVSQYGTVETQIDSPVWASNPGYKNGDSWTFHEADHGIPGYTFTLALSDIAYPGPAGWTANVLASEPPEYPSTVKSLGAVKLSANDKDWIFAPGGNLVFPDSSIQKSATNIIQSATTPETISTSTLWYDTVGGRSYVYYDSSWVDASPMPVVDTTQLTNNGYSLSIDSSGVVNLPTFSGSPSIAIVQTASEGIGLNANGTYFNFNQNGSLTFPDGGRVVLHPYGNSYIESVDYGITTSTSSLNIFAGPDQKITLRANFGGTEKFWTFGLDGSLTWPDTSVQTGASISVADLKAIITTCTNFTEFKNAILGL